MLLAGASKKLVCNALLVTNLALRKWITLFNVYHDAYLIKFFSDGFKI